MTENNTTTAKAIRALLKRPDAPPEIITIETDSEDIKDKLKEIIAPNCDDPIESEEYNGTTTIYYSREGTYNFGIAYELFFGNVVFLKRKNHRNAACSSLCDLTDFDIKRIKAIMKWG